MRSVGKLTGLIAGVFLASGCVSTNEVLFVTKTSVGVDFDTKPANVAIAYDRIEGYVGPRYANGAVPPVIASIRSDNKVFNPQIKQVYATGAAAVNLATDAEFEAKIAPADLSGEKKLMFFGTTTTTGLKVGFTSNIPDSLQFGYKRKEFSWIPLGTERAVAADAEPGKVVDVYPTVLAAIDTGAGIGSPQDTSLISHQFFATGQAAVALSKEPAIRNLMKNLAKDAIGEYRASVAEQQTVALEALRCSMRIPDLALPDIWRDAERHGLFYDPGKYDKLVELHGQASAGGDQDLMRVLRKKYADDIGIVDGDTPTRAALVEAHSNYVCDLAAQQ